MPAWTGHRHDTAARNPFIFSPVTLMHKSMTLFLDRWSGHPPYCYLEAWQRRWLEQRAVPHTHGVGSFPVVPGDAFLGIELMDSGSAELVRRDMNGKEVGFRQLAKGDIYGFTALFCDGGAIYGVRAVDELSVFSLSADDFTSLTNTNSKFREFFYREAMGRIQQAYLSVNTAVKNPFSTGETLASFKLEKALSLIRTHYGESISLEDAASVCGMSKYYYSRLFKSVTGYTFTEYLNRVRIEAAKEMLRQDRYNISEICYTVGYSDLSYFSKMFKRIERQSPSDYRRAAKRRQFKTDCL